MSALTAEKRPNRAAFGAVLIVAAVFLMSLQDAAIKYASTELPLWQIYVLRSLLAIPVLLGLAKLRSEKPGAWSRSFGRWPLLRSALLTLMYVCLYAAVPALSLSMIAAAFYTGPLFITALSALVIGEPVGRKGWLAITIGFIGVLIILRPAADAFTAFAILPVFAGFFYACAAIITRVKCQNDRTTTLAVSLNVILLVTGLLASCVIVFWKPAETQIAVYPFLLGNWVELGLWEGAFIGFLTLLMIGIGLGLAGAYQSAPPAVIASFDYSYLIFAAVWSYTIFAEPPDVYSVTGMVLITSAGILAIHR
jgi:drug/metabolite transporter (DMT)-like permease